MKSHSEVLIQPFFKGEKGLPLDFEGELEELLFLYPKGKRVLAVGLGERKSVTDDGLRRAYAVAARACQSKKITAAKVIVPKDISVQPCAEGIYLGNYAYTALKNSTLKENPVTLLKKIVFVSKDSSAIKKAKILADGVHFVRDLVNTNSDDKPPSYLVSIAKSLGEKYSNIAVEVLDKKRIEKEKMGLILAVSQGSPRDPALILLNYVGDPSSKECIALVGKGITFDTGGLNIKTAGMETMKMDMAGGAVILGTLQTAAALNLKKNILGVIPAVENSIGPMSYKPGDVYTSYLGQTVEVTNTDAEGRLILADALAYTVKNYSPTTIIDMGTLTGAIVVALGEEIAGLFCNNEFLGQKLQEASKKCGERIWPMPLPMDYKKLLQSDIGDIKNSAGKIASSIQCALFLQEFVGTTPWAHLDIAGVDCHQKATGYHPANASGVGVRLFIQFLEL